jgi:hypothetical protein
MKTMLRVCVVGALALAPWQVVTAQAAKFRHLLSIYADDKAAGFSVPEGVACGANGRVVVGDTGNNRLVTFTFSDKAATALGVIQLPQLSAPSRVRLTAHGEILVLDGREHRIVRLSASGEFKSVVAFAGAPAPSSTIVKSFAIDSADTLYVLDVFSERVLVVDAQDKFQRSLPFPDGFGFAADVAVDDNGAVLLFDATQRRLYIAERDAKVFARVGGDLSETIATLPSYLATSKGTIFVVEGPGSRIVSLRRDGTFMSRALAAGQDDGALSQPSQLCINDKDEVFVADRDNSRIQVFQLIR